MDDFDLSDSTPIAFIVAHNRACQLRRLNGNGQGHLCWNEPPRPATPDATEIEYDGETDFIIFRLGEEPYPRARVGYNRKRTRHGQERHYIVYGTEAHRGYVFGSDESCDVILPGHASGFHFRILLNKFRVWMVHDESSNGTRVNGNMVLSSARAWKTSCWDEVCQFKDKVALSPDGINVIWVGDMQFKIRVNDVTGRFRRGREESLVIQEEAALTGEDTSLPTPFSGATPADPNSRRSTEDSVVRREYYILNGNIPASRGKTRRIIRKSTGARFIGKLYNNLQEDKATEKRIMLAETLQAHDHILRYIDYNVTDVDEHIIVTEDLPAVTLEERLAAARPLEPEELVELLIQIMDALKYIHSKELIHCDIRPGTILWCEASRRATLTGFSECQQGLIGSGLVRDRQYRAREIRSNASKYDAKVDVYALCTVIHSHSIPVELFSEEEGLASEQLTREFQDLLAFGLKKQSNNRYSSQQMCDALLNLSGNQHGAPFRPLRGTRSFEVRCHYSGRDFYAREPDLWRAISYNNKISRTEYEDKVRKDNKAWPFYVPFRLVSVLLKEECLHNVHGDLTEEKDYKIRRSTEYRPLKRFIEQDVWVHRHVLSNLLNLTQLLKVVGQSTDTFDLSFHPSHIQEVYGCPEYEGVYIDAQTFRLIWEQQSELLRSHGSMLCSPPRDFSSPTSTTSDLPKTPIHQQRFLETDYKTQVLVFDGWRMIHVNRHNGSANLHQIKHLESAWQDPMIEDYVPAVEAAEVCEELDMQETASTLRRLGRHPPTAIMLDDDRSSRFLSLRLASES